MFSRRQLPAVGFLIVSLSLTGYLAYSTSNYLQFYRAVWNIGVEMSSVTLSSDFSRITTSMRVLNPESYQGLKWKGVHSRLSLSGGNDTLFDPYYLTYTERLDSPIPLGPKSSLDFSLSFSPQLSQVTDLRQFLESHPESVEARISVEVEFSTLLDKFTPVVIQEEISRPLTTSQSLS